MPGENKMSFEEVGPSYKKNDESKDFSELVIQNPSIKIEKNSRGYNYSFKVLSLDLNEVDRIHREIEEKIKEWREKEDANK